MTWFTTNPMTIETGFDHSTTDSGGWPVWRSPGSLGSAFAGAWSWSMEPPAREPASHPGRTPLDIPAGVRLRAPASILQRMAEAACALGRDESDIWVEAAREWLARHAPDDQSGELERRETRERVAPTISARRSRMWRDIDGVLGALRDSA